jgi:Fur family ferric uptake transcriptional regulator
MERSTRQRRAIQKVVDDAQRPINAEEVLAAAAVLVPRLGIATVYRTLKALAASGLLRTVELAGEPLRYETAGKGHHDHFRCGACKRVYEVEDCPVRALRLPKGFVAVDHEVIVHGTCADCQGKGARPSGPSEPLGRASGKTSRTAHRSST